MEGNLQKVLLKYDKIKPPDNLKKIRQFPKDKFVLAYVTPIQRQKLLMVH